MGIQRGPPPTVIDDDGVPVTFSESGLDDGPGSGGNDGSPMLLAKSSPAWKRDRAEDGMDPVAKPRTRLPRHRSEGIRGSGDVDVVELAGALLLGQPGQVLLALTLQLGQPGQFCLALPAFFKADPLLSRSISSSICEISRPSPEISFSRSSRAWFSASICAWMRSRFRFHSSWSLSWAPLSSASSVSAALISDLGLLNFGLGLLGLSD